MSTERAALALLVLAALSTAASAGSSSGALLGEEIGARAAGMGGAYSAVAEGAEALWWNPAGLPSSDLVQVGFEQSRWLEQFGLYGLQAAAPVGSWATAGAGFLYADYGTFELVDNSGATQFGRYSAGDLVAAGGLAHGWADGRWSVGAAGKVIQERIESQSANGAAVDVGGRWKDGPYSAAAVLQNVGYGLRFVQETDPLPTSLRVGGAWRPIPDATLALDMVRPRDLGISERVGAEYRSPAVWGTRAVIRLGYSTQSATISGLSYGFGVRTEHWSFDFAMKTAQGAPTTWLSMEGRFGATGADRPRPAAAAEAPAAPSVKRAPASVLADAMSWYRRKVAEGLLGSQERVEVLKRLLREFESQKVDLTEVRKELDSANEVKR